MCGRFGLFEEPEALKGHFHLEHREMLEDYERHWNISPTMPVLTVERQENEDAPGRNKARLRRWGLSGHSSRKSKGANRPLINARGETVHQLRSFREAFKSRRCLIPASGFFEWKKRGRGPRRRCGFIERTVPPSLSPASGRGRQDPRVPSRRAQ